MSSIPKSDSGRSFTLASYMGPPIAAAVAIVPAFPDFAAKSQLQMGKEVERKTFFEGMKGGVKLAPMAGVLIGTQMIMQEIFEKSVGKDESSNIASKAKSSFVVGVFSSPVVALFNGQAAGRTIKETWSRFTPFQALAIAIQEGAFVLGVSASEEVAAPMKKVFGDHAIIDYGSSFVSGSLGSLVGHPANTVLTRLQNDLEIKSLFQLKMSSLRGFMRGSGLKMRACGIFSVGYHKGKEVFQSILGDSKE